MQIIADLHLHSRFSRAVSFQMTIDGIAQWAIKKGIGLIATGDWTHPQWMREISENLAEDGSGLLQLSPTKRKEKNIQYPKYLLCTEISSIYSQGGKTRRIHTLVAVPSIASAQKINKGLTKMGCNLLSDGRPIIGLSLIQLAELVFESEPTAMIIPAHIWTPWFSVYGKKGGFESLEEAFGTYASKIFAVETGLSSSPDMNWRVDELQTRSIISSSDAHSGPKLGREATVFELSELTYSAISQALSSREDHTSSQSNRIAYTIEFYPEEGKYHYTGHKDCNVRLTPEEVVSKGATCPVCGKPLTQGVMQRVEELAGIPTITLQTTEQGTVKFYSYDDRPPFIMLVPLQEIISEAIGSPVTSPKTQARYDALVQHFGNEFTVLISADLKEITRVSTVEIADGVRKVRIGDIVIDPGFDGVFGVVKIWKSKEEKALVDRSKEQLGLF